MASPMRPMTPAKAVRMALEDGIFGKVYVKCQALVEGLVVMGVLRKTFGGVL